MFRSHLCWTDSHASKSMTFFFFLSPNLQLDLLVPQERFQDQIFPSLDTQRCLQSIQYNSILDLMLMHRSWEGTMEWREKWFECWGGKRLCHSYEWGGKKRNRFQLSIKVKVLKCISLQNLKIFLKIRRWRTLGEQLRGTSV